MHKNGITNCVSDLVNSVANCFLFVRNQAALELGVKDNAISLRRHQLLVQHTVTIANVDHCAEMKGANYLTQAIFQRNINPCWKSTEWHIFGFTISGIAVQLFGVAETI